MTVPTFASVPPLAARARSVGGSPVRDILAVTARPEVINFAGGLPAPELFDAEGIAAAFRAVLEEVPERALQYSTTEGEPVLRTALGERMSARGLATGADDVLVTTGSQQALSLLATALIEPGDTVLVETPVIWRPFRPSGSRAPGSWRCRGTTRGPIPWRWRNSSCGSGPSCSTPCPPSRTRPGGPCPRGGGPPSRPWPLGAGCGSSRTTRTANSASRASGCRGSPLTRRYAIGPCCSGPSPRSWPPGCGSAGCGRPAGCCGPARSPSRPPICTPRPSTSSPRPGTWPTGTSTRMCGASRRCMASGGTPCWRGWPTPLPEGSTWTRPEGGMFLWARLPSSYDTTALLPQVVTRDVAYVPGAPFYAGEPDRSTLRLCFVTQTPQEIREGLRRLGEAFRAAQVQVRGVQGQAHVPAQA